VEQYLDFALSLAQHYAILSRGEIVERGAIAELRPDEARRWLAV
jgi:urea transport system ATP-binding protein